MTLRNLALAASLFALAVGAARAEEPRSAVVSGMVRPAGYCQITVLTSAVTLTTANCSTGSVPTEAKFADVIVEGAPIRYRTDGTNPTASVGMPLAVGADKVFALAPASSGSPAVPGVSVIRFIQQSATATLNIEFFD